MSDCKNTEAPGHAFTKAMRKIPASYSIVLAIVIVVATALDIFLNVFVEPRFTDGTSPHSVLSQLYISSTLCCTDVGSTPLPQADLPPKTMLRALGEIAWLMARTRLAAE